MTARALAPQVARMVALRPGSTRAQKMCATLEHALLKAVNARGARGADRAIATLNRGGSALTLSETFATVRRWRATLPGGEWAIEISINVNRFFKSTSVRYVDIREPRLTKRQREIKAVQDAFYAKYEAAGQKAYATGRRVRLRADDRLALLIGELEADVNNGGFTQYLDNKGPRRAADAARALAQVGAKRTAALLAAAMAPGVTERDMGRLDDQFYKGPEDLAVYTMRHLADTRDR